MKRRYRGGMIVGVGIGIAAVTILAFTPASAAAGAAVHFLMGTTSAAVVATPAPTPVPPVPTVDPTAAPTSQTGGGVDTSTQTPPAYGKQAQIADPNGNVHAECPIHNATDPICMGGPISTCAPNQTTLTPMACQDPPVMGCPGAIHYPNGFTTLPPCVRPTPVPTGTPAPTPTPTPAATPAATPAPSATP